jgi:hypothetical protein
MGLAPQDGFVTRGLYATWRRPTVSGSALTLGFGATNRADKLFECLSTARLVLRVFALPGESTRNGPHENKQEPVPCLVGSAEHPPGPATMGRRGVRRERPVDGEGGRYITPLHTVAWGGAEDSSEIIGVLTGLDRGIRYVCQPGLWHEAAVAHLGARSERAGGGGCP